MSSPADGGKEPRGLSTAVKIGIVILMLAGAAVFLLFGSEASDAFIYSRPVDEVVSRPELAGSRQLRIEGELKSGSVRFREQPCEWRFVLTRRGKELPVRFPYCVVPDTFRDAKGIEVTVQGGLGSDGWFVANQLVPRCPSKYERAELIKRGEKKPHSGNDPNLGSFPSNP